MAASPAGLSSPFRGRPMLTAVVYVMIAVLPLYVTAAQLVSLDADLGLDAARFGVATALYFGVAAVIARRIGSVIARVGARRGLQIASATAAVAALVAATATTWWILPIAVMLSGVANAFAQVSTNVVLATEAAYRRQGMSFGAKQGAMPLASAVAGALLPSVGVAVGWRWPYVVAIVPALLAVVLAPEVSDLPTADDSDSTGSGSWRRSKALTWLAIGGIAGGAAGNALSLFVVPSAVAVGTSEAVAGTILSVGSALVFAVRVASGSFADRTASKGFREMIWLLAMGGVACTALAIVSTPTGYLIAMPFALAGAWGWPGLAYFTVVRIHPEAPAQASGFLLAANLTGSVLGPLVVGFLARRGLYAEAWALCAALAVTAAVSITISGRAFSTHGIREAETQS